jgi:hypothetical protein
MFKRGEENVFDTLQIGRVKERAEEKILNLFKLNYRRKNIKKIEKNSIFTISFLGVDDTDCLGFSFENKNNLFYLLYHYKENNFSVGFHGPCKGSVINGRLSGKRWFNRSFDQCKEILEIIVEDPYKDV